MKGYVIALDQGTTSSRAIVFNRRGEIVSLAQHDYPQIYPRPGWVEHDPADILGTQIKALAEAFEKSGVAAEDVAAIGVTNQRETSIVWDRATGKPVYNAIVWQCRRTAAFCDKLAAEGVGAYIRDKTGLLTDRKAKKFPVRCGLGVRTIYNPVPIYMGDKPGALTVDYGVAYFTLESREEAAAILDSIRQHAPFEGEFTRGLYFKGTN